MEIKSPYDQKVVGTVQLENELAVFEKLSVAKKLSHENPQGIDKQQRIFVLKKLALLVESEADSLLVTAVSEGGKPYADSKVEVTRAIQGILLSIEYLEKLQPQKFEIAKTEQTKNKKAWLQREPIGVVFAISAFNHPLNLIVHQVITAFAAGCPVLVKPDLRTPLSCIRLLELLKKAGCPDNWCQLILCENTVAEKLVKDPRINYLNFIGSAKVGWHLRSLLAPGTRCALEHGGLAPVIVCEDADFTKMIPALTKGAFYHAGQVCVSTQRIFVPEKIVDSFLSEFKSTTEKLVVGDPMDEKTQVGPIISKTELERIHTSVNEAIAAGAKLICGGEKISDSLYKPTILLNPAFDSKISTLEIFGPVVAVYSYSEIAKAISQANETHYHFQASVFSASIENAKNISNLLNASTVMINDHTAFRVDWMPFGGRDQSGIGVGGISYSIEEMMPEKLIVMNE